MSEKHNEKGQILGEIKKKKQSEDVGKDDRNM